MFYTPDKWIVIRIYMPDYGESHRVFAGWYGGYLGGDSWKLSSEIVKEEDRGDHILFHNQSGSTYHCLKAAQGLSGYMSSIFANFKEQEKDGLTIDLVERDFSSFAEKS